MSQHFHSWESDYKLRERVRDARERECSYPNHNFQREEDAREERQACERELRRREVEREEEQREEERQHRIAVEAAQRREWEEEELRQQQLEAVLTETRTMGAKIVYFGRGTKKR